MSDTPNLNLPYMLAAQAQKHVTHNEALRMLDAVVQISVLDRDLATPPGSPANGDRYIVAASPTGAWAGQTNKIAAFQDAAWSFYVPKEGWLTWVADENVVAVFDGAGWALLPSGGGGTSDHGLLTGLGDDDHAQYHNNARGDARYTPVAPTTLGVNATADTTNRLAVASQASLFNHVGNGHQVKINKNAVGDTASFLFQTGFSGRAEFGTTGDDNFHLKVSPNGSSWLEAMRVDATTGNVGIGATPTSKLDVNGTIQAGDNAATDGAVLIRARYDGRPAQSLLTERGTGAIGCCAYMYQNNSSTWLSSFAYGAIERCALLVSSDSVKLLSAPTQNVAAGSALTTQPTVKAYLTNGGALGLGTSPSYQLHLSTDSAAKPSTNTWTVSSDERLKENIVAANLDRCWEIVKGVPLKRYTWKYDAYTPDQVTDRSKLGWIAQDVQSFFKNAVAPHVFQCAPVEDGFEEYEEQETCERIIEREVVEIELRNGLPVQVKTTVMETVYEPVLDNVPIIDEGGNPVFGKDGAPITHAIPRMVRRTRPKMRTETIDDCLSLNADQLYAAMYGALQLAMQKIEVLEGDVAELRPGVAPVAQ